MYSTTWFNIPSFCISPHTVNVFVWNLQQTAFSSPYSIKLVFVTQTDCVLCEVWTETIISRAISIPGFPPTLMPSAVYNSNYHFLLLAVSLSVKETFVPKIYCPAMDMTHVQWPWHMVLQAGSYHWVWADKYVRIMVQNDKGNCAINWENVMTFNVMLSCSTNGMNTSYL
jgi:hypothetical protein